LNETKTYCISESTRHLRNCWDTDEGSEGLEIEGSGSCKLTSETISEFGTHIDRPKTAAKTIKNGVKLESERYLGVCANSGLEDNPKGTALLRTRTWSKG